MKKAPPWLFLLAGLMVGYPAARIVTAPAEKPQSSRPPAPSSSETGTAGQGSPCAGLRCEPVRILGEFFGLPGEPDPAAVTDAAGKAGYGLRFLVALVPAPLDPRLDQALDALQQGFAQSGYRVDHVWLPWTGASASPGTLAQKAPGILLFRRGESDGSRSLALVFLVGETPKAGIQRDAFREALNLAADLQGAASDPEVVLLGPSFSGSVESLRVALLSWRRGERERSPARPPLRFRAASGSATASDLQKGFQEVGVSFCRTVLPDEELNDRAITFLRDEMSWDLGHVALLIESDTAYGRSLLENEKKHEDV
ncbi:MAG TPA: hypothetical protein VGG03_02355, partial [Thermoanaerobaculia bacterium]